MFEIVLELESDKEKIIVAPEDWGDKESLVADKLCELLEEARSEESTFVCINDSIVRVENVLAAKVRVKSVKIVSSVQDKREAGPYFRR